MRALVFDYDGLIVDTEWPEYVAWQKVFEGLGLTLAMEDWMHVVGGPDQLDLRKELEGRLGRPLDWASIDAGRLDHHRILMAEQEILPGVRELMIHASAQGWAIGVASSSSQQWVYGNLRRLGLDSWVETLRTRDNVPRLKPHPDPYLLACEDLGADPSQELRLRRQRHRRRRRQSRRHDRHRRAQPHHPAPRFGRGPSGLEEPGTVQAAELRRPSDQEA